MDTGADETLLPRSIGDAIGAMIDDTQTWPVSGLSGQAVPVVLGEVELELTGNGQTFRWTTKLGFVAFADPADEVAILSHAGFLDFFRVVCEGHAHELEVLVTPSFPGTVS